MSKNNIQRYEKNLLIARAEYDLFF